MRSTEIEPWPAHSEKCECADCRKAHFSRMNKAFEEDPEIRNLCEKLKLKKKKP